MKAIVTGGCRGLGASLTCELLNRGYEVYALYNTSAQIAQEMNKLYENIKCMQCDITDSERIKALAKEIGSVDILINNAAIAIDNDYHDKSFEEFMEVVKVNLGGTYNMLKEISPLMKDGLIINISSNNTLGNNSPLSMDYDASKAGINMLTRAFAEALEGQRIKVIAVAPGWIDTEPIRKMNPQYLREELLKEGQRELLDPKKLAKRIIDIGLSDIKSGSIVEIKEL